MAELIEIPAGLAEKTMKGAEVFVATQLPGLNNAVRERRPEQRIQAQATAQKEEKLGRVKQG